MRTARQEKRKAESLARPDPTDSIADQAAGWAVDMAYGEMTAESRRALDAWLAADPRHRGAYARARRALCDGGCSDPGRTRIGRCRRDFEQRK